MYITISATLYIINEFNHNITYFNILWPLAVAQVACEGQSN